MILSFFEPKLGKTFGPSKLFVLPKGLKMKLILLKLLLNVQKVLKLWALINFLKTGEGIQILGSGIFAFEVFF